MRGPNLRDVDVRCAIHRATVDEYEDEKESHSSINASRVRAAEVVLLQDGLEDEHDTAEIAASNCMRKIVSESSDSRCRCPCVRAL